MNNPDHIRTLSIVRKLAEGKTLKIGDFTIGMGADMSIGCIMTNPDGEQHIGGLSTMDLAQFNKLLNEHNIGSIIPNKKP